jgi:glycosyltransferase involved in cell wall biosynthesis
MVEAKERRHVLMVTARYFPYVGGTETHVYEVSRRLVARGIRVTILTIMPHTSVSHVAEEEEVDGVRIVRVRAWPAWGDYYFAPQVSSVILRGGWDVVHCQGCHTFVPVLAMLAARKARLPYVVTFHSGGHSSHVRKSIRGLQWRLLRPLLTGASSLIGVSQFEVDYFYDVLGFPANRFCVIPNGCTGVIHHAPTLDGPAEAIDRTRSGTAPLIVSVGRLERYKGHQRLIRALPRLRSWRADVRLLIVGAGPYEAVLRRLARKEGVTDYVEIRAIAADDRQGMAEVLSQASLVALLSEYEAHPIAVMEALALGRSVLVADTSGLRELAQQKLVRSIALHSSPEEVAEAIRQQIEEPIVPTVGFVLPGWDECVDRLEVVYRGVMNHEEVPTI